MWIYNQRSGTFSNSHYTFRGYAGCMSGKNNPLAERSQGSDPRRRHHHCSPGAGPLPRGMYTIEHPRPVASLGVAMPLIPDHHHGRLFGRNDFYIHGKSKTHPQLSSDGCIILAPDDRATIWRSKDYQLKVIA